MTLQVRVFSLRQTLRMSLWFIPALSVVAAVILAAALITLDHRLPQARNWPLLFPGGAESARNLLSTIATAMVTSISLIFSVTMVVLQLASAQYSPRVLRTFLRDRLVQAVLGVYLSTFIYSLLVLPSVTSAESEDGRPFVPAVSVSAAVVLTLLSLGMFVRYIHHIAHSIRAVSVLQAVGDETREALEKLYPDEIGNAAPPDVELPPGPPTTTVHSVRPGVMVAVDEDRLLELAVEADLVVRIVPLMGDFVAEGRPVLEVWGDGTAHRERLVDCIAFANERTLEQDAAFGFRQIVDVAERALSPGVNDPTTAVQAIDQLHDLLHRLAHRELPSQLRVDGEGELRVIACRSSWDDYVSLAFDEIRLYSGRSVQVVRRLRGALTDLMEGVPPARRSALEPQLKLLERDVDREFDDPLDRTSARRGNSVS